MHEIINAPTPPMKQSVAITRQYDSAACHACLGDPVDSRMSSGAMQKIPAMAAMTIRRSK